MKLLAKVIGGGGEILHYAYGFYIQLPSMETKYSWHQEQMDDFMTWNSAIVWAQRIKARHFPGVGL